MSTYFESSALQVLEQLAEDGPKTEDDLYEHFDEEVFRLSLGGATLGDFLRALSEEGYLLCEANAYRLTSKGEAEVARLTRLVRS